LFLALWTIVPWRPAAVSGDAPYLDPSWMVALHLAFLDGLAFGQDIVFTYGPWGFVATRTYVPGTFGWLLFWWIAVAASIWYAAFAVALATMRSALWAAVWISALLLVVGMGFEAPFIAVVALFVVASAGSVESKALTVATVVLAALLAWLSLVKFTYLGLGSAVVLLVTAWLLVTRRRVGPALPVYVASWLGWWLLASQSLGGIPSYIANGLAAAAGYTSAMSLWSNTAVAVLALVAGAMTVLLVLWRERGMGRKLPVIAVGFGLTLYVTFKAGFVRQDDWHTPIDLLGIAVVAIVAAQFVAAGSTLSRRTQTTASAILVAVALGSWGLAPVPGPLQHLADVVRSADDTLLFFVRPERVAGSRRVAWSAALAEIRKTVPLPHIPGRVDLYPNDQLLLIANGLNRSSRPVFQSYFAYTPRLIALNEAHLRGEHRPRAVFVDIAPIDGHWPTSEDAPSLLSILSDYDLRRRTGPYLLFERAARVGYRLVPIRTVRSRLGESIRVPPTDAGPIWVTITVGRTVMGRLEEFAFRPAALLIDARLAGGRRVRHRLIPAVAEDGFLLSPYLPNRKAFAAMTTAAPARSLARNAVETIRLHAVRDRFRGYSSEVEVSFSRVVIPR
jgi:hypothetical protein